MKNAFLILLMLGIGSLTIQSCFRNDRGNEDLLVTTADDLSASEDYSDQTDIDVDMAIEERGGSCPTVTFTQPEGTWPNTITIDFGASCTRADGRVLSGRLIVNQTAPLRQPGAERVVNHDNFFVDGNKLEGTRKWINNGQNADGLWSYTVEATNMKLTFTDGTFTTWNKLRTTTLTEGAGTVTPLDDVWSSIGSANGINRNGVPFTATIMEPLIKRANCRWISEGIIEFTAGLRTGTLDFGNGTCDRLGTLTLSNGDSFTVRLRR
jgi:hypothetical protein